MKKNSYLVMMLLLAVLMVPFSSCRKEKVPEVIASFSYVIDNVDFKKVKFTNESQNYSIVSWNFGDNSAASTEVSPTKTYAALGSYTVSLTATSTDGKTTDVFTQVIVIADPNALLTRLVGETSKKWKLLRKTTTGRYPLQVGPWTTPLSTIWWAMGLNNDELAIRPCMLNDEWTFHRDGRMVFDAKGDYWAEGGVFEPANICASTTSMLGPNGVNLSAWGNGNHTFQLTPGEIPKLKVIGLGAYIGLCKLGDMAEVKVPQQSVTYDVIKLHDGTTDTLIVQGRYVWNATDPGGYWRFVLVSYDNPADEPPIPGNQPNPNFTFTVSGRTVTFNNTSTFSSSYLWDFGNGTTSTSENPSVTYATDGLFIVKLTATNAIGTKFISKDVLASTAVLTNALLQGAAWKVRVAENSITVGPGLGDGSWWQVPKAFLEPTASGTDNWSCLATDGFTFSAGGVYTYATNGLARNDGYFGGTNGCITDAQIAASGNGAAFGSGAHTYVFTPASGTTRATIVLTNGAPKAAFLGFYKGYHGGENNSSVNPPNGGKPTNTYQVMGYAKSPTKEWLLVSVDISATGDGSAAWNYVLER